MRKLLSSLLLLFGLVSSLHVITFAEGSLQYLVDEADLLTANEEIAIENQLAELKAQHNLDIVIVTTKDTGSSSNRAFADDYYDYNGFGEDGILLLINTNPNGWYLSTSGLGMDYLTDYGIEEIGSQIRPYLTAGDFYTAFKQFTDLANQFILQGKSGQPYDNNYIYQEAVDPVQKTKAIAVAVLLLALAIALGIVRVMAYQMNNVRQQACAQAYEQDFNLTKHSDIYLYSRTTSQKIQTSNGSSTHTGSSGRTHGGGGGRF